ncbi:MAG: acetyl-CoA C-acyltransferase [Acidimicrobiaceae bacterium]|nr:acetyl-CoA C-acyltransferase [Acidimicrobiaceae bacterium]|tara:strand:- start:898 stop:2082 length:1185 start_codon:yes stop_codon:yes gene_type:complete
MENTVILAGARTPIGKLSGALSSFSGSDLGGIAISGALDRAGLSPDMVDYVIMGQVLQAGTGQVTARQAACSAEIPMSTPAITINKVCLSGLNAIYLAAQMIENGDAEIVVAGGMESMTNAPYLVPKARGGYKYGNAEMMDVIQHDGLFCALEKELMGEGTERYAASVDIARESQDIIAQKSHERASSAIENGNLSEEIIQVEIPQRRGEPIVFEHDEGVRPGTDLAGLQKLRPAFSESGNITAGNASQISDGGSAVVVTSRDVADRLSAQPLAELVSYGQVAGPDTSLLTQPSRAISDALAKGQLTLSDIDLFEINEAFAAVSVASMSDLGIDDSAVNVNGGAIALGHPIGMSGNRLALTLAYQLRRQGGGMGVAALCGGGGQGDALILKTAS